MQSAAIFALCFATGVPISLLLPRQTPDRLAAAPVFGLASYGIFAALGYFYGASIGLLIVGLITWSFAGAVVTVMFCRTWHTALLVGFGVLISMICALPFDLYGYGANFFHTNPTDQINYISIASGIGSRTFTELMNPGNQSLPVVAASSAIYARPTAPLLLTVAAHAFRSTSAEAMMWFAPALQGISAFGVLFLLRNALRMALVPALISSGTFAVGFFAAYIVDINAFSSLSTLGFIPVIVTLVSMVEAAPMALGLMSAALAVFYPESIPAAVPTAFVIVVILAAKSKTRLSLIKSLAIAAACALVLILPVWKASVGFLFDQLHAARTIHDNWISVFDAFYSPYRDEAPLGHIVDVAFGTIGLFFLAPHTDLPMVAILLWRGLQIFFLCSLIAATLWAAWRNAKLGFIMALAASSLLPLGLYFSGDLWASGKAVSMISPLLFSVMVYPLALQGTVTSIPAMLLIVAQIGLGSWRVLDEPRANAFKETMGYPAVHFLLPKQNWNIDQWKDGLSSCHEVSLKIDDPFLTRVLETILVDTGKPYRSLNERHFYYLEGQTVLPEPPSPNADCIVRDSGVDHLGG